MMDMTKKTKNSQDELDTFAAWFNALPNDEALRTFKLFHAEESVDPNFTLRVYSRISEKVKRVLSEAPEPKGPLHRCQPVRRWQDIRF